MRAVAFLAVISFDEDGTQDRQDWNLFLEPRAAQDGAESRIMLVKDQKRELPKHEEPKPAPE